MKKLLSVLLAVVIAMTSISAVSFSALAEEKDGWSKETVTIGDDEYGYDDYEIWFYYVDGEPVTGWQKINGKWYCFDEDGWMYQDEFYYDEDYDAMYYFDKNGVMYTKGWYKDVFEDEEDGTSFKLWYYFGSNGKAAVGWKKISGKWYYFDKDFYFMYSDGLEKINGKYYYFNKDGSMKTGWLKTGDGFWYYFTSSGAVARGWTKVSGKWYYFEPLSDGNVNSMSIGWEKIGGKWYYFNKDGSMKTGWLKSGGKWYYLTSSGAMAANTSIKIGKKTYKFNSKGVCTNP